MYHTESFLKEILELGRKRKKKVKSVFSHFGSESRTKNEMIYITITSFIFTKEISHTSALRHNFPQRICISRCTFPKVTGT